MFLHEKVRKSGNQVTGRLPARRRPGSDQRGERRVRAGAGVGPVDPERESPRCRVASGAPRGGGARCFGPRAGPEARRGAVLVGSKAPGQGGEEVSVSASFAGPSHTRAIRAASRATNRRAGGGAAIAALVVERRRRTGPAHSPD